MEKDEDSGNSDDETMMFSTKKLKSMVAKAETDDNGEPLGIDQVVFTNSHNWENLLSHFDEDSKQVIKEDI